MTNGGGGAAGGGGGSFDPSMMAGYATQAWVNENYLSIEFFSKLFKAYDSAATPNEIVPNDTDSTITNIKAMFGFWTEQYLSALGQNSGGGGGGASALADLTDVALSSPTNGQALVYNGTSGKWENQTIGGGGGGTLTSIGLVMPTGFSVSPATLTADGSFTVSFTNGYALPTTADVNKGVTAYGWGNHASAGYLTSSDISDMATKTWVGSQGYLKSVAFGDLTSHPTTLSGYGITDALNSSTTFWGQSVSNGAVKGGISNATFIEFSEIAANAGYGGYIDFHYNGSSSDYTSRIIEETSGVVRLYGKLQIGDAIIEWDSTNHCLKITGGLYSTSFISALGVNN